MSMETLRKRFKSHMMAALWRLEKKINEQDPSYDAVKVEVEKASHDIVDMVKLEEGEEPPIEPPVDPPGELGPKIKQAHYGLFTWNWFLWKAWNPTTRAKWIKELIKTMTYVRKLEFAKQEIFSWVSSGRGEEAHYNKKLPWVIINNKVDFSKHEETWWDILKIFFKVHKDLDMEVMVTLFMRPPTYLKWALKNAKGGPVDFFSDEMFVVWKAFARRIITEYKKIYGPNACPLIKPSNEWNHRSKNGPGENKNENGYIFAMFHVAIYDAIKDLIEGVNDREKVRYIVGDPTLCEWVTNCFTHPHTGPGGYKVGEWRFVGPRPKKDRFVTRDHHRFSILADYMTDDFMITLTNSIWKTSIVICSEDGADKLGTPKQVKKATAYAQKMAKKFDRPISNTFMNAKCLGPDGKEDCTLENLIATGSMKRAEAFVVGIKVGLAS